MLVAEGLFDFVGHQGAILGGQGGEICPGDGLFRAEGLDVTKFAAVNVLKPEMRVKLDDLKQAETLPEVLDLDFPTFATAFDRGVPRSTP